MKKIIIGVVVIVAVIAVCFLYALNHKSQVTNRDNRPVVKIGFVAAITGMGKEFYEIPLGLKQMVKKHENGPIRYELIVEDSAGQALRGISAAKKLLYLDNVDVIFSNFSAVSQVVSPLATQKNVLHISIAIDPHLEGNPTTFTFWTTPEIKARKYVEFLKKNNVKNTAVLVVANASSEGLYKGFENVIKETDIKATKYSFTPGLKDYRIDLLKLKNKGYDLVTFITYSADMDVIARQYREMQVDIPVGAIECFHILENKKLFEGAFYVDNNPGNEKILEEIRQAAGTSGTYVFAQLHDALDIMDKVISDFYEKYKRIPNGQEMTDAMLALKEYNGVGGVQLITPERRVVSPPVLVQIIDGKPVIAKE